MTAVCCNRVAVMCTPIIYNPHVDHSPSFSSNVSGLVLSCALTECESIARSGTHSLFISVAANFQIGVVPGSDSRFSKQSEFHSNTTHFHCLKTRRVVYLEDCIMIKPILLRQLWSCDEVPKSETKYYNDNSYLEK